MKTYAKIDYDFRPASYWNKDDPLQLILRNVKGQNRRQMIIDYAEQGRLDELDEQFLEDEVDDATRQRLGLIHPSFMGGEYLPGYLPGEVEIARICLQSTTSDVISMRARPTALGKIAYRVVDEYEATFSLPIPESDRPLTLADLIRQFDEGDIVGERLEGGLSLGFNNPVLETTNLEERQFFATIESDIYDQLQRHFDYVFVDWYRAAVAERDRKALAQEPLPRPPPVQLPLETAPAKKPAVVYLQPMGKQPAQNYTETRETQ